MIRETQHQNAVAIRIKNVRNGVAEQKSGRYLQ